MRTFVPIGALSAGLLLAVLAGCASKAPPPPPPAPIAAAPAPPPPVVAQVAPAVHPARPKPDSCGSQDLQYLVGRPRTEIPIPVMPGLRRVACTTCPLTQDFVPARQTILFDQETGLIRSVRCG